MLLQLRWRASLKTLIACAAMARFSGAQPAVETQEPIEIEVSGNEAPIEVEAAPPTQQPIEIEAGAAAAPPTASTALPATHNAEQREGEVDVTVVGTRVTRTPGSAQVVRQAQLERFEYDDPHAALMQVPGIYVRQEDGVGLRPNIGIRGGNPDRSKKITLMEDGVLFGPAPYSAPAAYYFPLVTRMSAIKVIKGPSAVAFGPQTVGGAVDFISRPIPANPSGGLDLALGQYGYKKAHAFFGASNEQFGFLVEGVRLHNEGFKELPDVGDTGSTRDEWMVKGSYLLDPLARTQHEFKLKLGYSDEVSNETYLGLTDADFRDNPNRRYPASSLDQMRNHRSSLVLSHVVGDPSANWKLSTTAYRHDYERAWRKLNRFAGASLSDVLSDPESPANAELYAVLTGEADSVTASQTLFIGPNDRRFVNQGLFTKFDWGGNTGPLAHRLEAGVRLHNDSIHRHHSESGYHMAQSELVPDDFATLTTTANEASTIALAMHAMDALSWRSLTLTPGLRVEVIDTEFDDRLTGSKTQNNLVALMPGFGAYLGVLDEFGLLAGVYRGFSPPPPGGNENVEPEYSINYEAGARLSSGRSQAELIGFYNDYSNLTDICTFSGGCLDDNLDRQFDAGAAKIFGFEAYITHELRWNGVGFPLTGAYTQTRGEFETDFSSADPIYGEVSAGDEIPYLPRHQATGTLGIEWSHSGASAAVNYISAMREEAGSAPYEDALVTDDLFTLDVGAKVMPLPHLTIYGNIRNLTDNQRIVSRRPYGARPNAPRWLQVGAKLHF